MNFMMVILLISRFSRCTASTGFELDSFCCGCWGDGKGGSGDEDGAFGEALGEVLFEDFREKVIIGEAVTRLDTWTWGRMSVTDVSPAFTVWFTHKISKC